MRGKKLTAWLLALVMAFTAPVCAYAAGTDSGRVVVTILHTNDVHGHFIADGTSIGIAAVAAAKKLIPNALLADAGDAIHGLPFATVNQGADAVRLMEMAGYDVWTPGNHDFNYGYERLLALTENSPIDLISANINKDGVPLLPAAVIKETGGVRIGFFGLATPETYYKTAPGNITGLTFTSPVEAAKEQTARLKEAGADIIVALAHLGMNPSSGENTSTALAEAVPDIDVIIDGHSHSDIPEGEVVNGVLIASALEYSKYIGVVTITLDRGKNFKGMIASTLTPETAAELYPPDAAVEAAVDKAAGEQDDLFNRVVGQSGVLLSAAREPGLRTQETPLGNLVADALLAGTGADIAFINGGALRASLPLGFITKKDIVTCLPFGNIGVGKYVTPVQLKALMENGVSLLPAGHGGFPHIAGFSFTYDPARPVGNRVTSLVYKNAELDLTDNTTRLLLAVNDFTAAGGDQYFVLAGLDTAYEYNALDEMVAAYIQTTDKLYTASEGRVAARAAYAAPAEPQKARQVYTVAAGDELWRIGRDFGVPYTAIAELNGIKNPDWIWPGQKLTIPRNPD